MAEQGREQGRKCRYSHQCIHRDCPYVHPSYWNVNDAQGSTPLIPCHFGNSCYRQECPYKHSAAWSKEDACWRASIRMCRNGLDCAREDCKFVHLKRDTTPAVDLPDHDMPLFAQAFRNALDKSLILEIQGNRHSRKGNKEQGKAKKKEALTIMVESLTIGTRRGGSRFWRLRKWAHVGKHITTLFRLAFDVRDTEELFDSMWQKLGMVRESMRGNPNADDIWTNVTKQICVQLEALLLDQQRHADSTQESDLVALVSGRSHKELIKARFSVDAFAASVISRCIFARFMGTTVVMLRLTLNAVEAFSAIASKFKLPKASSSLVRSFNGYLWTFLFSNLVEYGDETGRQRQNENVRMLMESRTVFCQEVSIMERTFEVCIIVQDAVKAMGLWQPLSDALYMTTKILMEFLSEDKATHWPVLVSTYKSLSEVFLECGNHTFHAFALGRAAAAQRKIVSSSKTAAKKSLASLAVLAALAAPAVDERKNQFGSNEAEDFRRLSEIAVMFKLQFPPSRSTLCAKINHSGVICDAHPAAQKLLERLMTTTAPIDVCEVQNLLKELKAVEGCNPGKLVENEVLRHILCKHLLRLAEEASSVSICEVLKTVPFVGDPEEGYNLVLDVLLNELNIPVLVDQKSETVSFPAANTQRVNVTVSKLAHAATPARISVQVKRLPLPSPLFEDLELEANRSVAFHSLVKERLAKNTELKNICAENVSQKQQQKMQARVDEEMDKQKAQNDANTARMAKEYHQAEVKERRRLLIQRLQEKHKGLNIPPGIVELNQQSFLDNCTAALTAFQRKLETMKRADVRRMDHFERACREQDIPRRREIGESMAAQLETERATRNETFLVQHRKEHDEKMATRERLLKFLPHAAEYSAQLAERTTKTTKRDEQEELLRLEKARLAQAETEPQVAALQTLQHKPRD